MAQFFIHDPKCGLYAVDAEGSNKRDALNKYRNSWYPNNQRLPKGVTIWSK